MGTSKQSMGRLAVSLISAVTLLSVTGCGYFAARPLAGEVTATPDRFQLASDRTPCYLELAGSIEGLRMNCFDLDGVLHIHSSRWATLPRFSGESWTVTVRHTPNVRVELAGKIYELVATRVDDEEQRQQILYDRGYWYAWDGISVFNFTARREKGMEVMPTTFESEAS